MDAFERKVRPIYDALDSRNWKVRGFIYIHANGKGTQASVSSDGVIGFEPIVKDLFWGSSFS